MSKEIISASDIDTKTDREHVQSRVSMYLGSGSIELPDGQEMFVTPYVSFREIIDNAIDEILSVGSGKVRISIDGDTISVQDSGRGLPVDDDPKTGVNGIIKTMATLKSGGKFDQLARGKTVTTGLNGYGASSVNFVSKFFKVTVYRGGNQWFMEFNDGLPKKDKPAKSKDQRPEEEKTGFEHGTKIEYSLNPVFIPGETELNLHAVQRLMEDLAKLYPEVEIEYNGKTLNNEGGLYATIPESDLSPIVLNASTVIPGYVVEELPDGTKTNRKINKKIDVTAAISVELQSWDKNPIKSYANSAPTWQGGSHENALLKAIETALGDKISSTKGALKQKEQIPSVSDMTEGVSMAIWVRGNELPTEGQAKSKLGSQELAVKLRQALEEELAKWLKNHSKDAKLWVVKAIESSRSRLAAKATRDLKRKKAGEALAITTLPDKYLDCTTYGEQAELHIVEGDSALGTLKASRNAEFQALFPIRGKILNVWNLTTTVALQNQEVNGLATILGAGAGRDFDINLCRFGKIVFDVDADPDGGHIATLLSVVFFRLFKPLVLENRLYKSNPPLFIITDTRNGEKYYCKTDTEKEEQVKVLNRKKIPHTVLRAKGLGEIDADTFAELVMNPETRTLTQITAEDIEAGREMLDLAFRKKSGDADRRKEWFEEGKDRALALG